MLFVEQLTKINMPKNLLMKQFGFYCAAYSERIRLLESGGVLAKDFDVLSVCSVIAGRRSTTATSWTT